MVRAVLAGQLTGSCFDHAYFSSLSSERLCIFGLRGAICIWNFSLHSLLCFFSELSLEGLALDLVD